MTLPEVTEAEGELLEVIWRHGPLPPASLFAEVKRRRPWADTTIKTLLGRLIQKKAVRSERLDGRLVYRPLIEREACVEAAIERLAARWFDGDRAGLARFLSAASPRPANEG